MGIKGRSSRRLLRQARAKLRVPPINRPAYLPDDLIFDILSRLPEKSVCRFRCVSKKWCALTSDPTFVEAHKSRAEPFLVIASTPYSGMRLVDMDGNIVRATDGMDWSWRPVATTPEFAVCVMAFPEGFHFAGVMDLVTMKVLVVQLYSDRAWGYGHAVPSGAYKLVRFSDDAYCEVFTVGGGAVWKQRTSRPFRYGRYGLDGYIATINGKLYFLPSKEDDMYNVLCFDLESEEWKQDIKGPSDVDLSGRHISLGELNGDLCMAEPKNWNTNHGSTNIWLLTNSDKSIWVKAYTIPLASFVPRYATTYCWMIPLRVLPDGSKLLFYYCANGGRSPILHIYDPHYGTCTDVTKKLLVDNRRVVGFCSSHLERFVPEKIQFPVSSDLEYLY